MVCVGLSMGHSEFMQQWEQTLGTWLTIWKEKQKQKQVGEAASNGIDLPICFLLLPLPSSYLYSFFPALTTPF